MTVQQELLKNLAGPERIAFAGLLASLHLRGGRGERKSAALEGVFEMLDLPEQARAELRGLDEATADPVRFAAEIGATVARVQVVAALLCLLLLDGRYDAREREWLKRVSALLGVEWRQVQEVESELARSLQALTTQKDRGDRPGSRGRAWKIALAVVGGAGLLALTGGAAAPAIGGAIGAAMGLSGAAATSAGLAAIGGGSLAAGGLGIAGGTAVVAGTLGLGGGVLAGRAMHIRTAGLSEFAFEPLGGDGLHKIVAVSGWLSERDDLVKHWAVLSELAPFASRNALRWESQHLVNLGKVLGATGAAHTARLATGFWARQAAKRAGRMLAWPALAVDGMNVIDNPWHVGADRAEKAGRELAEQLAKGHLGHHPVTLVGFSLGGRAIMHCLRQLACKELGGIVQDAILLGAAVSPTETEWRAAQAVVAGRLVNAYCTTDWVLGYPYRAAQFKMTAAGLGPAGVPGVTDMDVTDLGGGHLGYANKLGEVLARVRVDASLHHA